jgi:hypothetical protein
VGKYRIGLVIFSFLIIYIDVYINKQTSSYFVSSTIFFAMLLYDYEKMGKTSKMKFQRFVSNLGMYTYCILMFINIIFMVCALSEQVEFVKKNGFIFDLSLKIFKLPSFDIGKPFLFLFVYIFALTLLEVLSEKEEKSVSVGAGSAESA